MNSRRLLQRFLRYVKIDTTAREGVNVYPSSPGQLKLGRLLVRELRAMGVEDAQQDEFGIVLATVPSTLAGSKDSRGDSLIFAGDESEKRNAEEPAKIGTVPTIAFCSHCDTSPETTGKNVKPQVIRGFRGGDIVLPAIRSR